MDQAEINIPEKDEASLWRQTRLRPWFAALAAGALVWQLIEHIRVIGFFYPLDYRENTAFYRALLVSKGRNLYDSHALPFSHSMYGFVNDYLAAPFVLLLGPGLFSVRIVSALAILGMSVLLSVYALRRTGDLVLAFAVFVLVYVAGFSHPGIFLGFPNASGEFWFVLSVMAPLMGRFSTVSLAVSLGAALLGFYTKVYFGVGPGFVLAYLLVARCWSRALGFALASAAAFGVSLAVTIRAFPYYYETTIHLMGALPAWDGGWLAVQSVYFLVLQLPLLGFLVWRFAHLPGRERWMLATGFSGIGVFVAVILLFKMGGNIGQYYLYFYQMLFPFLLLLALDCVGKGRGARYSLLICLLGHTALMLLLALQHTPLSQVQDSYAQIEARFPAKGLERVLADAPVSFYGIRNGGTPIDQGQTEFLKDTGGVPLALFQQQLAEVAARKQAGYYDLVITDGWQVSQDHSDLARCYIRTGAQDMWFYALSIPAQFWTRKPC